MYGFPVAVFVPPESYTTTFGGTGTPSPGPSPSPSGSPSPRPSPSPSPSASPSFGAGFFAAQVTNDNGSSVVYQAGGFDIGGADGFTKVLSVGGGRALGFFHRYDSAQITRFLTVSVVDLPNGVPATPAVGTRYTVGSGGKATVNFYQYTQNNTVLGLWRGASGMLEIVSVQGNVVTYKLTGVTMEPQTTGGATGTGTWTLGGDGQVNEFQVR